MIKEDFSQRVKEKHGDKYNYIDTPDTILSHDLFAL